MSHDQILFQLNKSPLGPRLTYVIARELFDGSLCLWAYGVNSAEVKQNRGVKKGSPESRLLFAVILARILRQAHQGWEQRGLGLRFPPLPSALTHVLFADDIFLFGCCEEDIRVMIFDITIMLRQAGLEINVAQTSFIVLRDRSHGGFLVPVATNKILGRLVAIDQPPDLDLESRIRHGFSKLSVTKAALWQGSPLMHRVEILFSTVLQAILWGAETWTPTKARLSRLRSTHLTMLRSFIKLPKIDLSENGPHQRIQHDRHCTKYMRSIHKPFLDEVYLRKYFRWGGHVARWRTRTNEGR